MARAIFSPMQRFAPWPKVTSSNACNGRAAEKVAEEGGGVRRRAAARLALLAQRVAAQEAHRAKGGGLGEIGAVLVHGVRVEPEHRASRDGHLAKPHVARRLAQHRVAGQHRVQPHGLVDARVEEGEAAQLGVARLAGASGQLGARTPQQLGLRIQVRQDPRKRDL